jgi:hypothetical protein
MRGQSYIPDLCHDLCLSALPIHNQAPKAKALGEKAAAFPAVAVWLTNENCNLKLPPRAKR